MAKEKPKTVVPKLRFPEFRELGAWDRRTLNELLRERKQRNRDLKYGQNEVLSVSGDHGCVNQIEHLGRSYAGVSVKDYHVVETGDIVYTKSPLKRNPYGIIKENKGKPGIVSTLYAVYSTTRLGHPAYLDHYFSLDYNLNSYLQPLVKKGAKNDMKVNNADALMGEIWAPQIFEQHKIADFLTSLNELIAAQGRKIEALKTYKRSLTQQLFPREGETVPRLRFSEFRHAPGWREVKAGTLFANRTERGHESLPLYSVTMTDGLVKRTSLDRKIDDLSDSSGNKKVCQQDIAYNMMRMWQGACGIAPEDCMVSPAYVVLSPNSGVHSPFYGYLFKLPHMLRLFTSNSRGLTEDRLRLYFQDFSGITMPQPAPSEQKHIADCLLALDARVSVESEWLATLKLHKQSLMQQLFPSVKEGVA